MAMAVPAPVHVLNDGSQYQPAIWTIRPQAQSNRITREDIIFRSLTTSPDGQRYHGEAQKSPYWQSNLDCLEACEWINAQNAGLTAHFAAVHHPELDPRDEILRLVADRRVRAVKIHTGKAFATPGILDGLLIKMLTLLKKPLILHIDGPNAKTSAHDMFNPLAGLIDPVPWGQLAEANPGMNFLLNHGGKLKPELLALVRKCNNLKVAIAPDLILNSPKGRTTLHHNPKPDYLTELLQTVGPSKLMIDTDFNWNVDANGKTEWGFAERLLRVMHQQHCTQNEVNAVFYANARKFFNF